MRTEKISLHTLLKDILNRDSLGAGLRREIGSALTETDPLVAWEKTLEIMQDLHRAGKLLWQGMTEKNGERYIRFRDPSTGNVLSLVEPPTVRAEVLPCLPRGFVGKHDSDKIESLFTSIATCRSEDELGGVLKKMLATIREMVSADFGAVYFTDLGIRDSMDRIGDGSPAAAARFAPSMVDRWVLEEGFCVHVPNLNRGVELKEYTNDGSFASVVVMPLRSRGKNYGVLEMWSRTARHFTTDDLGFLALLALLAAGMIRNAEHLESLIFRDPLTHVYNRGFMEDQLQRAVQGLGTVMASERQMEKQLNVSKEESEMWKKRAKDALEAGDENLAKKALAKKLEADEDVKQYEEIHEGISKQLSVLRGQVDILKEKLVEARTRQSMIIARDKVAEARKEVASAVGDLDSSGVFAKMDKMERKVAEKEAQADAAYDISGLEESDEDPFEKLEDKKALEDEFEALKKEMGK